MKAKNQKYQKKKLVQQFVDIFNQQYEKTLERNGEGFELEFINPNDNQKPMFKCRVWGETFQKLANEDDYNDVVSILAAQFIIACKANQVA